MLTKRNFWVVIKIEVKDNNVEQALRVLRKLQRDGFFKIIKLKNNYEKPSEKKKEFFKKNIKSKNLINLKTEFNYRGVEQPGSRKAHNLEVGGSNPSPATNYKLNFDLFVSDKKTFYCIFSEFIKEVPNFSILSIIAGGTVIIWHQFVLIEYNYKVPLYSPKEFLHF